MSLAGIMLFLCRMFKNFLSNLASWVEGIINEIDEVKQNEL
jgi:hypothetical protein